MAVVAASLVMIRSYFNPDARERRRRQRSHGKVISKVARPMVSLAVKTDEKGRKGR